MPRRWRAIPVVVLAAAVMLVALVTRSRAVPQPIAFNHRKHTQDLNLDCEFCHQYVSMSAHAGLPAGTTCGMCHEAPLGQSREAAHVSELLSQGNPLQFRKLFRLPAHVNFSHRRHVGIANLDCQRCHGGIATTERPPAQPLVQIRMSFCLDCHQASKQSLDCIACHR